MQPVVVNFPNVDKLKWFNATKNRLNDNVSERHMYMKDENSIIRESKKKARSKISEYNKCYTLALLRYKSLDPGSI